MDDTAKSDATGAAPAIDSPRPAPSAARTSAPGPRPRRSTSRRVGSALSVLLVTAASGLLFTVSAATNREANRPSDSSLVALVHRAQDDVADLDSQVSGLRRQVDSYAEDDSGSGTAAYSPALPQIGVTGPGVRITLTDATVDAIPDGATPNDLVIHQQDIEDVMNALWDGGAEAMSVQGVRVTSRTVVRCIGNVILVDGVSYSPPYVIEAIGDPDRLRDTVNANPRIVNYKAYVALYGLGWQMETPSSLELAAANAKTSTTYAQVVEESNG